MLRYDIFSYMWNGKCVFSPKFMFKASFRIPSKQIKLFSVFPTLMGWTQKSDGPPAKCFFVEECGNRSQIQCYDSEIIYIKRVNQVLIWIFLEKLFFHFYIFKDFAIFMVLYQNGTMFYSDIRLSSVKGL